MEYIEVSAKNVDDAITEASIQLGTTSDQIEYEVIEKGSMKKRFLGMVTAGILATVMLAGCGASASKVTAESLLQEEIGRAHV